MKKIISALIIVFLCSCKSNINNIANTNIENFIKGKLDNPETFELISIDSLTKDRQTTSLDTLPVNSGIKGLFDYKGYERYVDSVNKVRTDLAYYNLRDLKNIESGKLNFYYTDCTFRIKNGSEKKLLKFHFQLDTVFNIINYSDVTKSIGIIK